MSARQARRTVLRRMITTRDWTAVDREGVWIRRGRLFWYAFDARESLDGGAPPIQRSGTRRGAIVKVIRARFTRRADEVRGAADSVR